MTSGYNYSRGIVVTLPWDIYQPADQPPPPPPPPRPEPELPYQPPTNLPARASDFDFAKILKDAFSEALVEAGTKLKEGAKDYAGQTWDAVKHGETVDVLHPTVTATTAAGKELVVADARNRSWRTLMQGLAVDVLFAIIAGVATLAGADPFQRQTWIAFGALLIKSVLTAAASYFMRLRVQPTVRTRGEEVALMTVPVPTQDRSAP